MAERLSWSSPVDIPTINVKLKRNFEIIDAGLVLAIPGGTPNPITSDGPINMASQSTLLLVDTTAGAVTLTLPLAGSVPGYRVLAKIIDGVDSVTLVASGADTIDGAASVQTFTEVELVSAGAWVEI